jgi:hypothetical protein
MVEWYEYHVVAIGSSKLEPWKSLMVYGWIVDRVGSLGEKWRSSVEKFKEWYVVSRNLQGCSPCLCQLMTNGLASVSKYWTYRSYIGDMGPVSLVAFHRHNLGLSLLIHWLAWERNWIWIRGSVSQRVVDCVGRPFSREQWNPSKSIGNSRKAAMRGPREICMVEGHTRTERGKRMAYWSGFPL